MREGADESDLDADLDLDVDLDRPPPPAAAPRRTPPFLRRRTALAAGAVVVVVAALGAGAVAQRSADGDRGLFAGPVTAEGLFPVLAEEPAADGGFPEGTLAVALALVPGSARPVGTTATAEFWVARSERDQVCLLARDTSDPEGLGGTCGSAEEAAQTGLRLPAGEGVGAVLLPAQVVRARDAGSPSSALSAEGYVRVGDSLWVDGETAARTAEALVDAASVRVVVVPSQAHEGSAALPVFLSRDRAPQAVVLACLRGARVGVSVDRGVPQEVDCSTDANFVPFTGDGGPVRVDVTAPEGRVWAASVVVCTGSLLGPEC